MSSNDIISNIKNVLDYIEENIAEPITLDDLSQSANISKFHLHKFASHAVGQPLMSYIRARKLSASLEGLLDPERRIVDISLHYGFEYEQNYIRSFKKQFGITPSTFRKGQHELVVTERADTSHLFGLGDGIIFKPKFVFKPEMKLIGMRYEINIEENQRTGVANAAGTSFYFQHMHEITNRINDIYIGLTRWREGTKWEDHDSTTYLPSVQVSNFDPIPAGMEPNIVPANKYAVFKFLGQFHAQYLQIRHLNEIWSFIRGDRCPFTLSGNYHFEFIDPSLSEEDYCEVDIYVPV